MPRQITRLALPALALAALLALPGAGAVVSAVADAEQILNAMTAASSTPLPIETPTADATVGLPGQSLAMVPGASVYLPGLSGPAPCSLDACHQQTMIPGTSLAADGLPGMTFDAPGASVPRTCAPGALACLSAVNVPGTTVGPTPAVPGFGAAIPAQGIPALCGTMEGACPDPIEVERRELATLPPTGPTPLTPDASLTVSMPGMQSSVGLDSVTMTTMDPVGLMVPAPMVGDVGVTLCESTCAAPGASVPVGYTGDASVDLALGADHHGIAQSLPTL